MVICNIGDGSIGCGPVYESMNFATMDQYNTLWDEDHKGGLPIIYNIWNNSYGMGGQTCGETMGYEEVARLGAGLNPAEMHAERIDGMNPLAVIDAYRRKRKVIEDRQGPVLLDVVTYRVSGHSPSDSSSYRTKEEIAAWEAIDSIKVFGEQLVEAGVATAEELKGNRAWYPQGYDMGGEAWQDETISPRIDLDKNPNAIADMMFTNLEIPSMDTTRKPDVLMPKDENPRVQKLAKKVRSAYDADGKPVSKNRTFQNRDAIFEAAIDKFYQDPTFIAYGEDNRDWGGAFGAYTNLTESIPYHRFFNSPISEAAIVGTSVGCAMAGGRVMSELDVSLTLSAARAMGYSTRCQVAGDERRRSEDAPLCSAAPLAPVRRAAHSGLVGASTHIRASRLCSRQRLTTRRGLLNAASNGTDPVIFLESQRTYDLGEMFQKEVPAGYYEVKIGEPDIKREGKT